MSGYKCFGLRFGFIFTLVLVLLFSCVSVHRTADYKIKLEKVPMSAKFSNDSMSIWGASVVKGEDGLYHMYYSRWPKKLGWAWVTDSEIAHAVSSTLFGPYVFSDVALSRRGKEYWDGWCTHNPTIHRYNGKYYLYYMGDTGDGFYPGTLKKEITNWTHRNNQRIGVAVADNPNGPWTRFDQPLIDVGADSTDIDALMVSNPSVTQRPDGGYLMVYKGAGKIIEGIKGGPVVHCVATSDSPVGPFKKYNQPIFTAKGHDFPAEDPFIWVEKGQYHAILKDMHGAFTKVGQSLVLFDSKDGFDWQLSNHPLVSGLQIQWENGRTLKVDHLERPQLYLENGKPKMLLCASDTLDGEGFRQSFNVQIPIK